MGLIEIEPGNDAIIFCHSVDKRIDANNHHGLIVKSCALALFDSHVEAKLFAQTPGCLVYEYVAIFDNDCCCSGWLFFNKPAHHCCLAGSTGHGDDSRFLPGCERFRNSALAAVFLEVPKLWSGGHAALRCSNFL